MSEDSETPQITLGYKIDSEGSKLDVIADQVGEEVEDFSREDILALNTGADLVHTSKGNYKLISTAAESSPPYLYRAYIPLDSEDI